MGLDMYLMKDISENQNAKELIDKNREMTKFWETEFDSGGFSKYSVEEINNSLDECYNFDAYDMAEEVAYWRKANMIHQWFVENVQEGVDDCGWYSVSREKLEELLDLCEECYKEKDPSHLPPASGFFFGSTDIDEYYWSKIEHTITQLRSIINLESPDSNFLYHSSW